MVGHDLIIKNLKKFAEVKSLSHGYIFFGPEGVGKRLTALSLANYLESGDFVWDKTKPSILNDFLLIEPTGGSIGIDAVRELKHFLSRRPNRSAYRMVLVDKAEFLTTEAQNALLKITEEPPGSSLLIMIARDPEILMPTLSSRLQKIYFAGLKIEEVRDWLKSQGVEHGVWSVKEIDKATKESMGSPGLAMRLLKDEGFQDLRDQAERFLKVSGSERREFIKKLLEPEDFDILAFLDAVILQITNFLRIYEYSGLRKREKDIELWHRVLKLRQDFSNFPLNPRLQLEALLNYE